MENIQKISRLQQRIRQLDKQQLNYRSNEHPKQNHHSPSPLEIRYTNIQSKLQHLQLKQSKSLISLQNDINHVADQQNTIKRQFDKTIDKYQQQFDRIQQSCHTDALEITEELKQIKKNVLDGIQRKFKTVRAQSLLIINQEIENKIINNKKQIMEKHQNLIQKCFDDQQHRDSTAQFMINTFGDQIIKIQQSFKWQKQQTAKKNSEIYASIKKMEQLMMLSVEREKNEMLQSRISLQNILEEICYKIQSKVLGR